MADVRKVGPRDRSEEPESIRNKPVEQEFISVGGTTKITERRDFIGPAEKDLDETRGGMSHTLASQLKNSRIDTPFLDLPNKAMASHGKTLGDVAVNMFGTDLNYLRGARVEEKVLYKSTQKITTSTPLVPAALSTDDIEEIKTLYAGSEEALKELLKRLSNTTITPEIQALITKLAAGLQDPASNISLITNFTDRKEIEKILARELNVKTPALQEAIKQISSGLSTLLTKLQTDLGSTDATIVKNAMLSMTDLSGLEPQELTLADQYLTLFAKALALLSELRAKISSKEGELMSKEAQAKLAQIESMTKTALMQFDKTVKDIHKNLEATLKNIEAREKAKKWKILGPIITAIMTVVSAVLTMATAGAAAPLAIAIVAMGTLQICDQTMGVLDKLCDALKIPKDAGIREAFKFAVLMTLVVITSGGAIASVGTGQLTKAAVMTILALSMEALFSSGLVTTMFIAIARAAGCDEDKAMIVAMICTILTMILMLTALPKLAGKISDKFAKGAAGAGLEAAKEAGKSIALEEVEESVKAGSAIAGGAAAGVSASAAQLAAQQTSNLATRTLRMFERMIRLAMESAKNPAIYVGLLKAVAHGLQMSANIEQAVLSGRQAKLAQAQADYELEISQLTALFDELKKLLPTFDAPIKKINEDTKELNEFVVSMCSLFAQLIQDIGVQTHKLAARG